METQLLHHVIVGDEAAPRTAFILHGILGSHRNWRSFARRLAAAAPEWRFVLVDLRCHGQSLGLPGPHTLAACADDLDRLRRALGRSVDALIGHSFGGKVALEWATHPRQVPLSVWVLDSPPGATRTRADASLSGSVSSDGPIDQDTSAVERVMATLGDVPMPVSDRREVSAFLEARGFSAGLGAWMTTNLRRDGKDLYWAFELDGTRELLEDYRRLDHWGTTQDPPAQVTIHQVRAERSDRWLAEDIDALAAIEHPRSYVHVLPDAGHWLHVDNPTGLHALLSEGLAVGRADVR